jgi:hypothetical protein
MNTITHGAFAIDESRNTLFRWGGGVAAQVGDALYFPLDASQMVPD